MQKKKAVLVSVRLLAHTWRRTLITALAFAIGLASFAAFAGITAAARAQFLRIVAQHGAANVLSVVPAQFRTIGGREVQLAAFRSLTVQDVVALRAELGSRAIVAPVRSAMQTARWRRQRDTVALVGTTVDYFAATAMRVSDGAVWPDERRPYAVITRDVATALLGYRDPLGTRIQIGPRPFIVTGVVPSSAAQSSDMRVIVPLRWLPAADVERDRVAQIVIRVADAADRESVMHETEMLLRRRHRLDGSAENDFTIRDERALLRAEAEVKQALRVLLPAVAGVTLIIGGIGIVAVMLLAIRERSAEIGLRRAAGASRRDIVWQFVMEAWLIACPAAMAGEAAGVVAAFVVARRSGWPLTLAHWPLLLLAFAVAAAFATLCSLGPALRAARFEPATALRLT